MAERAISVLESVRAKVPDARLDYEQVGKILNLSPITIAHRFRDVITKDPSVLLTEESRTASKRTTKTFSLDELEVIIPKILRNPPGRRKQENPHVARSQRRDTGATRETVSNPFYDPRIEIKQLEEKELRQRLARSQLEFTRIVLSHINAGGLKMVSHDPVEVYAGAGLSIPSERATDQRKYVMASLISVVGLVWHLEKPTSVLEGRLMGYCEELKKKKKSLKDVMTTACKHFRFEVPRQYAGGKEMVQLIGAPREGYRTVS